MKKWDFGTSIIEETPLSEGASAMKLQPLGLNRTYGVLLQIKNNTVQSTQIHYNIEVTCLEVLPHHNFLFRLSRQQMFINEKPASSMPEEFAEKCGQVFYPLHLEITPKGKAIGIANYPEIVKRWNATEKELLQYYKNAAMQSQIQKRRAIIQDKKRLSRMLLTNDWFTTLYFSGIPIRQGTSSVKLPVFPSSNVAFSIKNSDKQHPKNPLKVKVSTTGKCVDNRSEFDLLKGNPANLDTNPTVKGEIEIFYQLNEKAQFDSVVGNCNLVFPSGKKRIVNWEIYNLKNKIPKTLAEKAKDREAIEAADKKELKEKQQKKTYKLFGKNFKFGKNK